jgi:hypothetical protein
MVFTKYSTEPHDDYVEFLRKIGIRLVADEYVWSQIKHWRAVPSRFKNLCRGTEANLNSLTKGFLSSKLANDIWADDRNVTTEAVEAWKNHKQNSMEL